jgi:hypothetical protein
MSPRMGAAGPSQGASAPGRRNAIRTAPECTPAPRVCPGAGTEEEVRLLLHEHVHGLMSLDTSGRPTGALRTRFQTWHTRVGLQRFELESPEYHSPSRGCKGPTYHSALLSNI